MRPSIAAIGSRVRDRRRELGLTQARLAAATGASQSQLSLLERGHPHSIGRDRLDAIARQLDLDLESAAELELAAPTGSQFCSADDCPSATPATVRGRLVFRPQPVRDGSKFCRWCAEPLESGCPHCGAPVDEGIFCAHCGEALVPVAATAVTAADPAELVAFVSRERTQRGLVVGLSPSDPRAADG